MKSSPDETALWQPRILDRASEADEAAFQALSSSRAVWRVHDTLDMQVRDLVRTRHPRKRKLTDFECEPHVRALLGDTPPERYGRWIHYPWSGELVHALGPAEYRELRSDRNRYKMTLEEQDRLAQLVVGIAGLSVGNIVAITLALEGVCGHLKLADYDTLELSNMNRIRAGVHQLGVRKTVLAARQIFEFDPYARITLFDEGVTEQNLDAFLLGEPRLDVLIDECDAIAMKFRLRERARELRIPVVMETSDRGMLDIERFDLEPERPSFHGLVGDVAASELVDIDSERKATLMMRIIGADTTSSRACASMMEIDRTISAWPQLASDVTLGGATTTVVVRRLGLGQHVPSGRRYVDMERVIAEGAPPSALPGAVRPSIRPAVVPARAAVDGVPDLVRFVVEHAALAPSGGNCQPWRFRWDGELLWVLHDRERAKNLLDGRHHASWIALGAALENLEIAAAHRGSGVVIDAAPLPDDPTVVAAVRLTGEPRPRLAGLFPSVARRITNRRRAPRSRLEGTRVLAFAEGAAAYGAQLELATTDAALDELGDILGAGDRLRILCAPLHREMMGEMRWTRADVERTRDGVDVASLELDAFQRAAIGVVARIDVADAARALGRGRALEESSRDTIAASSAVGLISFKGGDARAWLRCGRAIQRVWLSATAMNLALHPVTALLFLFEIAESQPDVFSATQANELDGLRRRLGEIFPSAHTATPAFLFRLAHASDASARSLRLPLEAILESGAPLAALV